MRVVSLIDFASEVVKIEENLNYYYKSRRRAKTDQKRNLRIEKDHLNSCIKKARKDEEISINGRLLNTERNESNRIFVSVVQKLHKERGRRRYPIDGTPLMKVARKIIELNVLLDKEENLRREGLTEVVQRLVETRNGSGCLILLRVPMFGPRADAALGEQMLMKAGLCPVDGKMPWIMKEPGLDYIWEGLVNWKWG